MTRLPGSEPRSRRWSSGELCKQVSRREMSYQTLSDTPEAMSNVTTRRPTICCLIFLAVLGASGLGALLAIVALCPRAPPVQHASCAIFCEGPILEAVQLGHLFVDSKTFV